MALGEKIKVFGIGKFGSIKNFANAVGKTSPDLSRYLGKNPSRVPGAGFLQKLYNLGCDLNWLFGDQNELPNKKSTELNNNKTDHLYSKIAELEAENKKLKKKLITLAKTLKE
jgi:transcriptional regulator with XRE-family HTH domain